MWDPYQKGLPRIKWQKRPGINCFWQTLRNNIFGIQRGKIFGDLGPLLSEAIALISRALYLRPVTHLDPLTERFHQSVILHLYSLLNTSLTFSPIGCVTWTNWMAFQTKRFVCFLLFWHPRKTYRILSTFLKYDPSILWNIQFVS